MHTLTRFSRAALALAFLACPPAMAQETQPGDACTVADRFTHVGGPENPGTGYLLVCDGSNWQLVKEWNTGSGRSLFQIDNDAGSCTAAKLGRLRYDGTSTWEYCDGSAWQSLTGGGGGTPAGADTQIQFNDSGAFGASSRLTWDDSARELGLNDAGMHIYQEYNGGTALFVEKEEGTDEPVVIRQIDTSGYGDDGDFVDILFELEGGSGGQNDSDAGRIGFGWEDSAARTSYFSVSTGINDALTERMRITADGNTGIGTNDPKAPLHVAGEAILGNTSLTCDGDAEGGIRWNSTDKTVEMCDGTEWRKIIASSDDGDPSTPPSGTGYFVVTAGTWDGDLKTAGGLADGLSSANQLCLDDLTNNDWLNKSDANSRGLLVNSKVKAFLCHYGDSSCQTPLSDVTYSFAVSGEPTMGGAQFTADSLGQGPNNTQAWSGTNYFNGAKEYWTCRGWVDSTAANWDDRACDLPSGEDGHLHCSQWTSTTTTGEIGISGSTGESRWDDGAYDCSVPRRLICMVHP